MKKKNILLLFLTGILAGTVLFSLNVQNYKGEADCVVETAIENPNVNLGIRAKSAYLMDFSTQTAVYSMNEEKHLPIASMCKIMTLILAFDAIDSGALSLDEEIVVSNRAASMGGSQVFLEANGRYLTGELIKSIIVCSANDSCVAIAERVAGSEELFVDMMNKKAVELGANDTLFANCTGLPKEPQYSCAKDVALMLKELLKHERYFEYGRVWMDKFQHPGGRHTEITNTNKLVRFYDGCDGGKTGFTNEAGFCLAATAKRKDMRIISVVIGEENSQNRFDDVRAMFDYAFANYTTTPIFEENKLLETSAIVVKGKEKQVAIYPERTIYAFTRRGEKANVGIEMQISKVNAPLQKGQKVGELVVFKDGVEIDRVALLTAEAVHEASFFDCLRQTARAWNMRK